MMNKISMLMLFCFLLSCNNEPKKIEDIKQVEEIKQKAEQVKEVVNTKEVKSNSVVGSIDLLEDMSALEKDTSPNPIESFKTSAKSNAKKIILINKENIVSSLEEAKGYKHAVMTVGIHTIVKVTDLSNCKTSASWGACMPYAEGYVKKGSLQPKADYVNNIIGIPDSQERSLYLFN